MTTQLKSVGDAVQIVALIIGGSIILNVPNCASLSPYTPEVTYTIGSSTARYGDSGQHPVHRFSGVHGIPPAIEHMG